MIKKNTKQQEQNVDEFFFDEEENEQEHKKYITLDDGMDFRTIAKTMTAKGYPMNHATARNVYMSAMKKFFNTLMKELKLQSLTEEQFESMLKSEHIHEAMSDLLYMAYEPSSGKGKLQKSKKSK